MNTCNVTCFAGFSCAKALFWAILVVIVALLQGCVTGTASSSYSQVAAEYIRPLRPGKAAVIMTEADENYVYKGHPAAFVTLKMPLGKNIRHNSLLVFGTLYAGGADLVRPGEFVPENYEILVYPSPVRFSGRIRPNFRTLGTDVILDIGVRVRITGPAGTPVMSRNYWAGGVMTDAHVWAPGGRAITHTVDREVFNMMLDSAMAVVQR